jgi:methylmalonyl-CoA mutase N-terminal domain/subunit
VGVNKFRSESNVPFGAFRIDPNIENRQIVRLDRIKKERNGKAVQESLDYVREVAESGENLVPAIMEAVRVYATIGEICNVLREIFGEYEAREYFS